jgi:hypothetical protein
MEEFTIETLKGPVPVPAFTKSVLWGSNSTGKLLIELLGVSGTALVKKRG